MRSRILLAISSLLPLCNCSEERPVQFEQLHVGYNASSKARPTARYTSVEEVRQSWIAAALTQDELSNVLKRVNFQKQALIAMARGKATTTGIQLEQVKQYRTSVSPYMLVGVIDSSLNCEQPRRVSYPFVLFTIAWPNTERMALGYDFKNYPDGCKPTIVGSPNNTQP